MRIISLSLFVLFFIACKSNDPKKILFLGDSITYAGDYITFIETYHHLNYPDEKINFLNAGLPSETVSGLSEPGHADNKFPRPNLHERLERVISVVKPDIVYACYGMNDAIYLPFDSARFSLYQKGIIQLHNKIIETGATIIHVTPPVYDERGGKIAGYSNVLDAYAQWLIDQRSHGWDVVDVHFPMKKYLEEKTSQDSSFAFAADGVHPGKEGHWLIARSLLSSMYDQNIPAVSFGDFIAGYEKGEMIYKLVDQKQKILKDAYLTRSGHHRPEMNTGVPFDEAHHLADSINTAILSVR